MILRTHSKQQVKIQFFSTHKIIQIAIDNGIVLGRIHRQSRTGVGYHRHSGRPKGRQNNGEDSFQLGTDNVGGEHGAEVHQDDNARNGKGKGGAKDGPSSVRVGVGLGVFL
jgi:hypothetical protein